jgi:hypothetical protein
VLDVGAGLPTIDFGGRVVAVVQLHAVQSESRSGICSAAWPRREPKL